MKTMAERMTELQKPLDPKDIELRIGHFMGSNGFCLLLAYKTARVDAERLDKVFPGAWGNTFSRDEKGILSCTIRVWNDEIKNWVERTDVGVESNTEKEKGEASDAFKRAGTKWGIGTELYDLPPLKLTLRKNEWEQPKIDGKPMVDRNGKAVIRSTFELHLDKWTLENKNGKIVIKDENNALRFISGEKADTAITETTQNEEIQPTDTETPNRIITDSDIKKAREIAGLKPEWIIDTVKTQFAKKYKDLTQTEKATLLNLIQKELNK